MAEKKIDASLETLERETRARQAEGWSADAADHGALPAPPLTRAEIAALLAPASRAITLAPPFNDLVLGTGDTLHEVIEVTVPKSGSSPVDVYFLADTTGSMSAAVAAVQ